jgi:hypothetical protein
MSSLVAHETIMCSRLHVGTPTEWGVREKKAPTRRLSDHAIALSKGSVISPIVHATSS